MSPIITHEDELELAKIEKQLASQLKKDGRLAKNHKKYRDEIG